jgi:hypothetical protein
MSGAVQLIQGRRRPAECVSWLSRSVEATPGRDSSLDQMPCMISIVSRIWACRRGIRCATLAAVDLCAPIGTSERAVRGSFGVVARRG